MGEEGRIDEDVYSLEQAKKLVSDMYNYRINDKGGVQENDKYADELGGVIGHLEKAISHREEERPKEAVDTSSTIGRMFMVWDAPIVFDGSIGGAFINEDVHLLTQDCKAYILTSDEDGSINVCIKGDANEIR